MEKQLEVNDSRIEEFDLNNAVDYVFNFVSTIPEFWKQASYAQRMKIQCLIFPEKLNYDKKQFRTPKLLHIFQVKQGESLQTFPLVDHLGTGGKPFWLW